MLEGSCLCGAIRYRVDGEVGPIMNCHCSQCRKASGAAFATNASVAKSEFSFVSGEDQLGRFESSPGQFRCFCSQCGSPLIKLVAAKPDEVRIRLGTLDSDPGGKPKGHFLVSEKAPWTVITDDLPQVG